MDYGKIGRSLYRFAGSTGYDPSAQTEDLGDDPVKASTYGLNEFEASGSRINGMDLYRRRGL